MYIHSQIITNMYIHNNYAYTISWSSGKSSWFYFMLSFFKMLQRLKKKKSKIETLNFLTQSKHLHQLILYKTKKKKVRNSGSIIFLLPMADSSSMCRRSSFASSSDPTVTGDPPKLIWLYSNNFSSLNLYPASETNTSNSTQHKPKLTNQ